jgi:acetolactate synthase-1/2/3 large subunit
MESDHRRKVPIVQGSSGSDYMADVIKSLGIEHVACNPGTSFRGLRESQDRGQAAVLLAHGTVGLQHASMALVQRLVRPCASLMMVGNTMDATQAVAQRRMGHSVQDAAAMVRDFVKWDVGGARVQDRHDPAVGAVLLVLATEMQEGPIPPHEMLVIPRLPKTAPLVGDPGAISEAAQLLVDAANPVIVADRLNRSQAGIDYLVELVEVLQCAVVDLGGRMNFPSRHQLNQSDRARAVVAQTDVIVGL